MKSRRSSTGRSQHERPAILLVEDHPGDVRLIQGAFNEAEGRNVLYGVTRGKQALDYLHQRGDYEESPRPDIVLLDLNLPGMNGFQVLEEIAADPDLKRIPVIVLTSSEAEDDIAQSYENHANAYLTKSVGAEDFIDLALSIGEYWLQTVELQPNDD